MNAVSVLDSGLFSTPTLIILKPLWSLGNLSLSDHVGWLSQNEIWLLCWRQKLVRSYFLFSPVTGCVLVVKHAVFSSRWRSHPMSTHSVRIQTPFEYPFISFVWQAPLHLLWTCVLTYFLSTSFSQLLQTNSWIHKFTNVVEQTIPPMTKDSF